MTRISRSASILIAAAFITVLAPTAALAQKATAPGLELSPSTDPIAVPSSNQLTGGPVSSSENTVPPVPSVSASQALSQAAPSSSGIQQAAASSPSASTNNSQSTTKIVAPAPAGGKSDDGQNPSTLDGFLEWIVRLFAGLVGIAGVALNVSAYYSIVRMGALVGQLGALQTAWGVFRDLGNIVILFGFIAMGIATILDAAGYNYKKMLVTLIIVAVAINFSSLAARAVIDVGNIVGIQFYKAFNNGTIPTGNIGDNGISDALMNSVGLTSVYNQANQTGSASLSINYPLIAFLSIILFIVIAFVFFSIAFLLIARFVILIFLITVSPLAFAGYVIPKFRGKSDEWLSALLNNTLVAPLVLLLLLLSTKIVTSGTFTNILGTSGTGWAGALNSTSAAVSGNANIIVVFMIACGFYLASLILAKQLSAFGAGTVMKVGTSLQKSATNNLLRRPAGALARNTVGRAGVNIGRGLREIPGLHRTGQRLMETSQGAKFGARDSLKSLKEEDKKIKLERETARRKSDAKSGLADAQLARDNAMNPTEAEAADHRISTILSKQSSQEIEELDGIKDGVASLVQNLSPQQFKNLMDSKTLTESQKANIRTARFAGVNSAIATAEATERDPSATSAQKDAARDAAKKQLAGMTAKELENADPSFLESDFVAENLTDKQYEDLSKGEALSPAVKNSLNTKRKNRLDPTAPGNSDAQVADRIKAMKGDTDAIGKVRSDTLERPGVLSGLGLKEFDAIRRSNKIGASTRQIIGAHLNTRHDPDIARYLLTDPRAMQYFLM